MIKQEDYIMERNDARYSCRGCDKRLIMGSQNIEEKGEIHHGYRKSQYRGDDRDQSRNLFLLCVKCHRGDNGVHNGNRHLDRILKRLADQRKPPEWRSETKVKRKKYFKTEEDKKKSREIARENRRKQLENFKKQHEGRTPSQENYRYQKEKTRIQKK